MFWTAKTELVVGRANSKGVCRVGSEKRQQEGCQCQPSDGGGGVSTNCTQQGCLQQVLHGVAGGNAESSGDDTAHGTSSAVLRPTESGNEPARTTSVDAQRNTPAAAIPVSDTAPDTPLPVRAAAAAAEGVVGNIAKGQAGGNARTKVWGSVQLMTARKCCYPPCTQRSTKGCSCDEFCTDKGGNGSGVLMCRRCFRHPFYQQAAAAYFHGCFGRPNRKPMEWLPVSDPVSTAPPPIAVPAISAIGRTNMGVKTVWGGVKLKAARKCCNPHCSQRSANGCSCDEFCTDKWGKGKGSGVLMCLRCFSDPRLHAQAATAYFHGHHDRVNRKLMKWLPQA